MDDIRPYIWIVDSAGAPLAECLTLFEDWADFRYFESSEPCLAEDISPDAIFLSAGIEGGAAGPVFARLRDGVEVAPLLVVSALRSLTQALAYFRAGAMDYLSLPTDAETVRDCLRMALERAERMGAQSILVEFEQVDGDPGDVDLNLVASVVEPEEDILAGIRATADGTENPLPPNLSPPDASEPDDEREIEVEEAEPVDGLPIPTLWEELPCGLVVFDSRGNLVFSNHLGLTLFGAASLAELQESLESRLGGFAAHGANRNPLPDNQWPHILARRTRTARSAVVSVERADQSRAWLRIDCLPHVSGGRVNRLTMTVVNITGELPPLVLSTRNDGERGKPAKRRTRRKR